MIWLSVVILAIFVLKQRESDSVVLIRGETEVTTITPFASADPVVWGKATECRTSSTDSSATKSSKPRKPTVLVPVNVNVNHAGLEELCTIKGVGPVLAQRILDYRKAHGPFASVDELDSVKGIGAKTVEKLKIQKVWAGKK